MNQLAYDLLTFYQRELMSGELAEAKTICEKLGLTDTRAFERYGVGYCSGAAIKMMGEKQQREGIDCGLLHTRPVGENFRGTLVIPVYGFNEAGQEVLVDLHGVRAWESGVRYVSWQPKPNGLIGQQCLAGLAASELDQLILCDNASHFLHAAQHGYTNLIAIREVNEVEQHLDLLERSGVKRVCLASRLKRKVITSLLESRGIKVKYVKIPHEGLVIPKANYEAALNSDEKHPAPKPPPPEAKPKAVKAEPEPEPVAESTLELTGKTDSRLIFIAHTKDHPTVRYALDSTAMTGLAMKVQLRAQLEDDPKVSFLDKIDLGVATQRRKTAKQAAARLGVAVGVIEDHLSKIADQVDRLILNAAASMNQRPAPHELSTKEREEATAVLKKQDVLSYLTNALDRVHGFVGEDKPKRLALLVAASRLLPQPQGVLLRGPKGSGKSALMQAVLKTLPPEEVLYVSRMTPQALFFLPKEQLQNKLLVADEFEGIADCEYAIRTLLSSQLLSVAITSREGGRVPVTRTIQVPAHLAVMVSTTGNPMNDETLSRFVEITLSSDSQQTMRVMRSMVRGHGIADEAEARKIQNVQSLLKPCEVVIPFADKLAYECSNVVARRQFAQALNLVAAHAVLHQQQRSILPGNGSEDRPFRIEATREDYVAVHGLLGSVVDHFEEDISPSAMRLLQKLNDEDAKFVTRQQVMDLMNWSYSRAYRTIQELTKLDLLLPDHSTNGCLRTFEVAASHIGADAKVSQLAPPEVVFSEEAVAV